MKLRSLLAVPALCAALAPGLSLEAAKGTDDPLRLVPPGAATVGLLRVSDLRSSPLAPRLFSDMDNATIDGDGARFLAEANLRPVEDVDTVAFAASPGPKGKGDGQVLVICEGRFDPARLTAAATARGGLSRTTKGGDYILLHSRGHDGKSDGAVAFVSPKLFLAGSEAAVVEALAARAAGGTAFTSGAGAGRLLARVDTGSSGWLIVDKARFPQLSKAELKAGDEGSPVRGFAAAMKDVSFLTFQMTTKGDSLSFSATGFTENDEMRELLEDATRGILAAWRIASQEKPDVVSVLRKFKVSRDREGVTISGTLPGEMVRALAEKSREAKEGHHGHGHEHAHQR